MLFCIVFLDIKLNSPVVQILVPNHATQIFWDQTDFFEGVETVKKKKSVML